MFFQFQKKRHNEHQMIEIHSIIDFTKKRFKACTWCGVRASWRYYLQIQRAKLIVRHTCTSTLFILHSVAKRTENYICWVINLKSKCMLSFEKVVPSLSWKTEMTFHYCWLLKSSFKLFGWDLPLHVTHWLATRWSGAAAQWSVSNLFCQKLALTL